MLFVALSEESICINLKHKQFKKQYFSVVVWTLSVLPKYYLSGFISGSAITPLCSVSKSVPHIYR